VLKKKKTKSHKVRYDILSFNELAQTDEQKRVVSHWVHTHGTSFAKTYEKRAKKLLSKETFKIILEKLQKEDTTGAVVREADQLTFFPELFEVPFPPPKTTKFTFIDLFAGIGGFRLALQNCGGKCVFSSECDEAAQQTYFANYGELPFSDIIKEETKTCIPNGFDVLCASFPSVSRKSKGSISTSDSALLMIFQVIQQKKPKIVFFQNVHPLDKQDKARAEKTISQKLSELGYKPSFTDVSTTESCSTRSEEYTFIIGTKEKPFDFDLVKQYVQKPLTGKNKDGTFYGSLIEALARGFSNQGLITASGRNQRFTHVDCFSGVGGICTGMHAAGFETLVAIERVKSCVETYKANHPDVHVIHDDIRNVMAEQILPFIPMEGVDLVTSGMPCETFSTAGNTSRSFYDDRQFLFREGIRIAKIANAKFVLFENVPAITTKKAEKDGSVLIIDILKKELIEAGYKNYREVILDATKFGVPQKRKRYFILATRNTNIVFVLPVGSKKKPITVKEALLDIPSVTPNTFVENKCYLNKESEYSKLMKNDEFWKNKAIYWQGLSYHMPMKHRPATLQRFTLLKAGESLKDLFLRYKGDELYELQQTRVLPNKMFIKRNYRLPLDGPAPTLTSHCLDEFVHPTENRALTVRECARLQSFPDFYDFAGGPYIVPHINREVQDKYEQIGDAVPPLLSYAWGITILELLKDFKNG